MIKYAYVNWLSTSTVPDSAESLIIVKISTISQKLAKSCWISQMRPEKIK